MSKSSQSAELPSLSTPSQSLSQEDCKPGYIGSLAADAREETRVLYGKSESEGTAETGLTAPNRIFQSTDLRGAPISAAAKFGAPDAGSVPAQRSLWDAPLRFDGSDYLPWRDDARLTGQLRRVWGCVRDGFWWTPSELERATGDNWSSISAQLRHLHKERFGSHTIERAHLGRGLYQYRLVTNSEAAGATNADPF